MLHILVDGASGKYYQNIDKIGEILEIQDVQGYLKVFKPWLARYLCNIDEN